VRPIIWMVLLLCLLPLAMGACVAAGGITPSGSASTASVTAPFATPTARDTACQTSSAPLSTSKPVTELPTAMTPAHGETVGPTPTLTDPHHHVVDVLSSTIPPEIAEKFAFVKIELGPQVERYKVTVNAEGTYQAFCIHEVFPDGGFRERLIVEDSSSGENYEIQGISPLGRDFSSLVWIGQVLVFDKWSQPHYGWHYAVDVPNGTLIQAAPFPDRLPSPGSP